LASLQAKADLFGSHRPAASGLFRLLQPLALAQAHTGTAAVFGDELDARLFKGASDFLCCIGATCYRSIE
jgi:hypothetical protein